MAERATENNSNYQTRPIDPTQIIPGTYYVTEERGSFQLYGKDDHNIQVNFSPATMQVESLWVNPGWFRRSVRPFSGDYNPKDMRLGVTLDESTHEPTAVSLTYDPSEVATSMDVNGSNTGQAYLYLVPFAETEIPKE